VTWSITKAEATTYTVRSVEHPGEWAIAVVREWRGGGLLSVHSSFGNYTHSWSAIGPDRFIAFLLDLNFDYFMRKTRPNDYRVFDAETARDQMKLSIIEHRRWGEYSKEVARLCWNEVEEAGSPTAEGFFGEVTDTIRHVFGGYWGDLPSGLRDNPECRLFWDTMWPGLREAWRHELAPAEASS
jgi:hypothetical protein